MTGYPLPIEFLDDDKIPDWLEVTITGPILLFPRLESFWGLQTPEAIVLYPQGITFDLSGTLTVRIPYGANLDDILGKLDLCLKTLEDEYCLTSTVGVETRLIHKDRDSFTSFRVSPRLVIVPAWEDTPCPGEIVIRLNPGRAFGTGQHPSTLLCLRLLEEAWESGLLAERPAVLDVGTGTGILSIAAAKLGSRMVVALEVDNAAAEIAEENIRLNNMGDRIRVTLTPLSELEDRFGLIMANVAPSVALCLSEEICRRLLPDGLLIVSGTKRRQLDALVSCYQDLGLKTVNVCENRSWAACLFREHA